MNTDQNLRSALSIKDIVQIKEDTLILDHLSIDLQPGELIALLGPNGAGKSSLLAIAAGLGSGHKGEIFLGNELLYNLSASERSQRIGFLPQRAEIAWPLDVITFVGLGRLPYQGRFTSQRSVADHNAITAALKETGVETMRDRSVDSLSGGELSRVLLARVLAGEPEWLMLDEPMTGLDPGHQFELCDLLRKLTSDGKGIIVTLHDLSLAAHLADRVVLLKNGKLIADGTPREVLTASRIHEVYGVACDVQDTSSTGFSLTLRPNTSPKSSHWE